MNISLSNIDWKLLGAALLLSLIGILLILSAQHNADNDYQRDYYLRQLIWLFIALFVCAIVIYIPPRIFDMTAYMIYGVSILLLIMVLLVGSQKMGAMRWFSFGPINFAPSDLGKVAFLFALSRFFAYSKLPVHSKKRLLISAVMTIIPVLLILKQPDLGTSLVFWVILFILWFWSGLSPLYILLIVSPIISLVTASHWLAWAIYFVLLLIFLFVYRPGFLMGVTTVIVNLGFGSITPFIWNRMAEYQKLRLLTFLDPGRAPRGAGYQIIQSKIAIGSGGLVGKGYLDGSQTRLDFLPEPHTDFIFSVLGEEFGFLGALLVLFLFLFIFYRAIKIASRCRSKFASLMVMGATSIIIFQFIVNIGMTLGIMPVTGLPLPFLSYGGTSLVLFWGLIGLIVSADLRWQEY